MARRVLADYDDAVREDDNAPLRGRLRITVPNVFGRRHVAPAMIEFLDLHPALQVELVFNDRNLDMIEHGLDLAVRIGPLPDTGMVARQVGQVRRMLVASPAYLARRGAPASPRELDARHHLFRAAHTYRMAFLEAGRAAGSEFAVRLAPRLIVNEVDTMLLAVLAGRGIGRPLSLTRWPNSCRRHPGAPAARLRNGAAAGAAAGAGRTPHGAAPARLHRLPGAAPDRLAGAPANHPRQQRLTRRPSFGMIRTY